MDDELSWELVIVLAVVCLPALLYIWRTPHPLDRHGTPLFIVITVFAQLFGGLLTEKLLGSAAIGWLLTYVGLLAFCWWLPKRERNIIGRRKAEARLTEEWAQDMKVKRKWWHLE